MQDQLLGYSVFAILPVMVRIAAMVLTMPLAAHRTVPMRVKLALIVALSMVTVPAIATQGDVAFSGPAVLVLSLFKEALIGAVMGLSLSLILAGVQLAGSLIEGLCGFSGSAFGSTRDSGSGGGPMAQLFWWTTIAVFIAAGGVGRVVDGLLGSFTTLPVGSAVFEQSLLDFLVLSLGQAFEFGLSAALPAVAALLVASVVLGMAQRNFPQLGGMQVGLNIKAVFGMVVASAVLLSTPWIINGGFELTIDRLQLFLQKASTG